MNKIEHSPLMFLIRWQIVWHELVYICSCQSAEGGYTHSFFVLAVLLCYFVKLLMKGIQLYEHYRLHNKLSWMTQYNIASSFSHFMQQCIIALHQCHCARKDDRVTWSNFHEFCGTCSCTEHDIAEPQNTFEQKKAEFC